MTIDDNMVCDCESKKALISCCKLFCIGDFNDIPFVLFATFNSASLKMNAFQDGFFFFS